MGAEMDRIIWIYDEQNPDAPAAAEVGFLCMYVSRVADCLHGRWVWTGDVPDIDPEAPRPAIHGIARSRAEAIAEAEEAARHVAAGGLRVAATGDST